MRPANGSAVVLKTNSEHGPGIGDLARALPRRSACRRRLALGGRGQILDDEVEDQVACRCCAAPRRTAPGRCASRGRPARGRRGYAPPAACPCRRTLPSARRCLRPPFRPALRGAFCAASARSAGNVAFLALAVAIRRVGVGLHADQVDHALEIALGADGDLNGHGGAAEGFLHARQGALEDRSARGRAC